MYFSPNRSFILLSKYYFKFRKYFTLKILNSNQRELNILTEKSD